MTTCHVSLHFYLFALLNILSFKVADPSVVCIHCSEGSYSLTVNIYVLTTAAAAVYVYYTCRQRSSFQSFIPCSAQQNRCWLERMEVKWRLLHLWLWLLYIWLYVPSVSNTSFWSKVRISWHDDPLSSWKILFDDDGRCCPTFCLAPLGTVLTLPSSPGWKQRSRRSETTALNTALQLP